MANEILIVIIPNMVFSVNPMVDFWITGTTHSAATPLTNSSPTSSSQLARLVERIEPICGVYADIDRGAYAVKDYFLVSRIKL